MNKTLASNESNLHETKGKGEYMSDKVYWAREEGKIEFEVRFGLDRDNWLITNHYIQSGDSLNINVGDLTAEQVEQATVKAVTAFEKELQKLCSGTPAPAKIEADENDRTKKMISVSTTGTQISDLCYRINRSSRSDKNFPLQIAMIQLSELEKLIPKYRKAVEEYKKTE